MTSRSIVICYAHEDASYIEWLDRHLAVLKRHQQIRYWSDRNIPAGTDPDEAIAKTFSNAGLAILLVSQSLLNSSYVLEKELPLLKKNSIRVIPIAVRPSSYFLDPTIKQMQFFNDPEKPLSKINDTEKEELGVELTREIVSHFQSIGPSIEEEIPREVVDERLSKLFRLGIPASVPITALPKLNAPSDLVNLLSEKGEKIITVSRTPDKRVFHFSLVSLDTKQKISLDNQRFKIQRQGIEETVFETIEKEPYSIELRLSHTSPAASTKIHISATNSTVLDVLPAYRFTNSMKEYGCKIFLDDFGKEIGRSEPIGLEEGANGFVELLERILDIQKAFKRVFQLPGEEEFEEQANIADEIHQIITDGKREGSAYKAEMKVDRAMLERILKATRPNETAEVVFSGEMAFELMGQPIIVGPEINTIQDALLEDRERLQKELEDPERDSFELIVKSQGAPVVVTYPNWPRDESE